MSDSTAPTRYRRRVKRVDDGSSPASPSPSPPRSDSPPPRASRGEWSSRLVDAMRMVCGLLLLNCILSYFVTNESLAWGWRPWFSRPRQVQAWLNGPVHLTDAQLLAYDGTDASLPLYLALNGSIYDVSAGRNWYGPGGSYHFFAGRDAARAFVTGCFEEDLTPDLRGVEDMFLPPDDSEGKKGDREEALQQARQAVHDTIHGWESMFSGRRGGKDYFKVGEVVRPERWLEALPRRELCERARRKKQPGGKI